MFVRSNMDVPVTYNKSTGSVVLKPHAVTFVADTLVTAEELKSCYGDRISILSNGIVEQIIEEEAPVVEGSKVETPNEGEENEENAEGEEATGDDSDESEESNTGDKDVDDFLNGETDVLPEGTTEITEEEALKLKEQAEAKAKEEAEKLEALKAQEAAEKAQAKTNKTKANNKGKATKKNK